MKWVKNYFLRRWLKNYYELYAAKKTPTSKDIVESIAKDINLGG